MTKPYSLNKHERLKSKKEIDTLFLKGKAFFVFPYKVFYSLEAALPNSESLLFGISVPKRNFKKAVHRNRLKRLTRELYRVRKPALKECLISNNKSVRVMMVYTHKEMLSHADLSPAMDGIFKKMIETVC